MSELPAGTVTFLFTDIEGSTRLWERFPDPMQDALKRHDTILRQAIETNQGSVVKTTGDGMLAAFQIAGPAVMAALQAQQKLQAEPWAEIEPEALRVRMALHSGAAGSRSGDYFGPTLNRLARLMSAGFGGQVLLSENAADLARDRLPVGAALRDLGEHRLKDLSTPEHVFQLLHPSLPAEFPPLQSLDSFPNNLPQQLTSFVGREKELAEARARFSSARLLTLIGPGGTGKTRLALQLAADLLLDFPDGAWLAELATLTDPSLVLQTVAGALNVREISGLSLQELLVNYLKRRRLLLVLDNCEHLVEASARLADHLLHACPKVQILASSREALGIGGEAVYRVPPLALPEAGDASPDGLCAFESVQLFVERAEAVQSGFQLNAKNASAVAQICRRLDGIPLALELAAARVRMLGPEQIASRLDDRFRLLTGGSRTALPRQQTLRSLIDWSYDLLTDAERTLFRRLAVFVGGWSFEAAEAIAPDLDVWDLLDSLVNKSLVAQEELGGVARFRLLETVRQYARDRLLESSEVIEVRRRHFRYFYELIDPSLFHRPGSHTREFYEMCEREKDNLRAALQWGLEDDPEETLELAGALADFWTRRAHFSDARSWLLEALKRVESLPEVQGERFKRRQLARAKAYLGLSQPVVADRTALVESARKCVTLFREFGDQNDLGFSLGILGFNEALHGESDLAEQHLTESMAIAREIGDLTSLSMTLGVYGMYILLMRGDPQGARRVAEESGQIGRQLSKTDIPWGAAMGVMSLALLDLNTGQLEQSRQHTLEAQAMFKELGDPMMILNSQSQIGHIELASGNFEAARQIYRQTLTRYQEYNFRGAVAHQLEQFAAIAVHDQQSERAARLFGAAEALRQAADQPMAAYEKQGYAKVTNALREQMPPEAIEIAWAAGRALTMEQAIDLALG
jgi:predicted ATPase/class 3 adenylate cyclase